MVVRDNLQPSPLNGAALSVEPQEHTTILLHQGELDRNCTRISALQEQRPPIGRPTHKLMIKQVEVEEISSRNDRSRQPAIGSLEESYSVPLSYRDTQEYIRSIAG